MGRTLALTFNVFKLRIGIVIALTALAGAAVTPGAAPGWQVALLGLAVLVASASAGAFNQYYEVDLDRQMSRTRRRPFAAGALAHRRAWAVAIVAMVAGATAAAWIGVNPRAAVHTFLGAFFYAVVYTVWLKRRTWLNIVIGGLAGSFAVLAGAAVVTDALPVTTVLLAVILFLWTPPHFWSLAIAYRGDYETSGVPMLPTVVGDRKAAYAILAHVVVLSGLSVVLALELASPVVFLAAVGGGALFLRHAEALVREPSRRTAMRTFHASLTQLSLLLFAALIHGATGY
jgi:protoheme IX farnesyltransferase